MTKELVLQAEGLCFSFGKTSALGGVDLTVEKGEIFGIVGPDGAGKTTLIRIFCGLLAPNAGSCRVLGFDTVKQKTSLIRKIGYLSQRFSLYSDLSVEENIDFFAEIHGVKGYATRKNELLDYMDLNRFRNRLSGALSGGMKQKLALACTLIHTPQIIFLDEPTNGVDPVARRDFWDILAEVSAGGVTIVISTPYLDEAERCRRVAFMDSGRVITIDTPRTVKGQFPGQLIEVICDPIKQAREIATQMPGVGSVQIFGDKIHIELTKEGTNTEILRQALSKAVHVASFRPIRPTLEDVFIRLLTEQRGVA